MEKIYKIEESKLHFTLIKLADAYVFGMLKDKHCACRVNCAVIPPFHSDEWELCVWVKPESDSGKAEEVARVLAYRTSRYLGIVTSDIRIAEDVRTGLVEAKVKFEF